ncbi:hypothetical protein N7474_004852 [Penicillium riverlandense]|uniref:uncharacterized protein n=1 Tax=Penicillium riverlandense TaxID=1903569 RepID=UPI002548AD94|nr:uncharacterized protein N7474_004852 [Penicillium riverlandense]KAJ5819261.1 hypothetical protein N7474_004852 [Penicillium riverlandense]
MSWQPKLRPKGFPHTMDSFAAMDSFAELEHRSRHVEDKRDQRVFRVKRKHVLKACDRCRVKKTKCDGKQPCNRCSVYNHPCLFRERKATQTKVYSRGFVEMLESHHSLVVKALQKLYKFCINNEGFPGEPLAEAPDGHPLTHTILDRLGLIKQAEENADDPDEDSEDLRYLRLLSTSTECSATAEPSPEPATPPEPSPTVLSSPSSSSACNNPGSVPVPTSSLPGGRHHSHSWSWDMHPVHHQTAYHHSFPENGFQHDIMAVQRNSIGGGATYLAPTEIPSHVDVSAGSSVSHDSAGFPCYLDASDRGVVPGGASNKPAAQRVPPGIGIMGDAHSHSQHLSGGGMSSDMLGGVYHYQNQEASFYHGFTPGWTFPAG